MKVAQDMMAIVIATDRGLSGLAFADHGEEQAALADMTRRWPNATYVQDNNGTAGLADRVFDTKMWRPDQPLRVVLIGTDFEVREGETLLKIPMGRAVSYSVPSRARQERCAHRLSLGHHPQAGDAGLGSGSGGIALAA